MQALLRAEYPETELPHVLKALKAGQAVLSRPTDPEHGPFPDAASMLQMERHQCALMLPVLKDQGDMIGLLLFAYRDEQPGEFSKEALDALQHFARVVQVAIDHREQAERAVALEMRLRQRQRLESLVVLAGGVAHDFNNCLQVIAAHAALLADGVETEADTIEWTSEILRACASGGELTKHLLLLARQEPESRTSTALNTTDVLPHIIKMASKLVPESHQVVLDAPSELPTPRVAQVEFEQAIVNLVNNALMPETGVITVKAIAQGDKLRIAVSDTGIGMTPDQVERACDPFVQARPANGLLARDRSSWS